MKTKLLVCLALVLCGGLCGCTTRNETSRRYIVTSSNPSEEMPTTLEYAKPSPETLQNIKVKRISLTKDELTKLAALTKDRTNNVTWLAEINPDTMRADPWNTQFYIFDITNTNRCIRVELKDHASGGVHHSWINDELLFVTVWWGHCAWTDFILNVETDKLLYMKDGFENIFYGEQLPANNEL